MPHSSDTRVRLASVALELFLDQGIKKTSIDEVAVRAGLTRVTAYRHFSDRQDLVRAAFGQVVLILEQAADGLDQKTDVDLDVVLDQVVTSLAGLGRGYLPARLEELARLYPEISTEFHEARRAAVQRIFDPLIIAAERAGRLRPGLHRGVIQAYFSTAVVNVLTEPSLLALDLPASEIFSVVKNIFLHGILTI